MIYITKDLFYSLQESAETDAQELMSGLQSDLDSADRLLADLDTGR